MRRHPRFTAVLMWAVMAAISVVGFAAFDADPPAPPDVAVHGTIAKADLVGGIGTSDALPTSTTSTTSTSSTTSTAPSTGLVPGEEVADPAPGGTDDAWTPPESVERWRVLLLDFFAAEHVDRALRVMWCESRGDPDAVHPGSGAAGLFQHLPVYWEERSAAAGFGGSDVHDPEANAAVAGWLVARDGWRHWLASQACWDR